MTVACYACEPPSPDDVLPITHKRLIDAAALMRVLLWPLRNIFLYFDVVNACPMHPDYDSEARLPRHGIRAVLLVSGDHRQTEF